jgi:hypothetical protein
MYKHARNTGRLHGNAVCPLAGGTRLFAFEADKKQNKGGIHGVGRLRRKFYRPRQAILPLVKNISGN